MIIQTRIIFIPVGWLLRNRSLENSKPRKGIVRCLKGKTEHCFHQNVKFTDHPVTVSEYQTVMARIMAESSLMYCLVPCYDDRYN